MKKKLLFIFCSLFVVVVMICLFFLQQNKVNHSASSSKLSIVASFYPLADFAQQVGGDLVEVKNLTPVGVEPHDFEPSAQDLVKLYNAKVFFYNGAGLEIWWDKISDDMRKKMLVVNASQGISYLHAGVGETNNQLDPHVWLDPVLAIQEVENIKNGLVAVDPFHKDIYEKNAAEYQKKLADLDREFRSGLQNCQRKEIVTSHNAFAYLAQRYHVNVLAISGLSPDDEPSAQKMAEVVQFVQTHQVKFIFFESLASPKLSQTLARETGAQTLAFNPLEGLNENDIAQGTNYINVQRENLAALRIALSCK
jgi:zinc transport system substrate-binding protein